MHEERNSIQFSANVWISAKILRVDVIDSCLLTRKVISFDFFSRKWRRLKKNFLDVSRSKINHRFLNSLVSDGLQLFVTIFFVFLHAATKIYHKIFFSQEFKKLVPPFPTCYPQIESTVIYHVTVPTRYNYLGCAWNLLIPPLVQPPDYHLTV